MAARKFLSVADMPSLTAKECVVDGHDGARAIVTLRLPERQSYSHLLPSEEESVDASELADDLLAALPVGQLEVVSPAGENLVTMQLPVLRFSYKVDMDNKFTITVPGDDGDEPTVEVTVPQLTQPPVLSRMARAKAGPGGHPKASSGQTERPKEVYSRDFDAFLAPHAASREQGLSQRKGRTDIGTASIRPPSERRSCAESSGRRPATRWNWCAICRPWNAVGEAQHAPGTRRSPPNRPIFVSSTAFSSTQRPEKH
jgi:hypothetical protein